MAADLGTWPAEQASVLLEVLQANGLHPEARRTRGEVHVSVPEDEGDKAHATLVAHMDAIARAARPTKPSGPGRGKGRLRAVDSPPSPRNPKRRARKGNQATPTKRSMNRGQSRLTKPAVIAILGSGAAILAELNSPDVTPSASTFPLLVMTAALVWVLGKQADQS